MYLYKKPPMQIKRLINHVISETINRGVYYRATKDFLGNEVVFEPTGYYEEVDDEGSPLLHPGDVWKRSNVPEVSASKTVGGAVLGLWTMGNHHNISLKFAHIGLQLYLVAEFGNENFKLR
jgi:hypothetical protein